VKLYKLTDENAQTYGRCQWGKDIEHTASGKGTLCGPGWLHAYTDPLLAVLMNPVHRNFKSPQLWEAEGDVGATDHGLKVGCTRLKTVRKADLPVVTKEQRIRFAIICAQQVCVDKDWNRWAELWLNGIDRSQEAARAAEAAARAAWAAEAEAAWAAEAEAAWAARAAEAEAAWAAWAEAAWAAAWTAAWAVEAKPLDLIAIAREACNG
jgi:hypothetical protein